MTPKDVIQLPVSNAVMLKSAINAVKKYRYTYTKLMYNRTPLELLDNLFMGDLAKNVLYDFLKINCKTPVVDYDEIRTDHFLEPDAGWDFTIGKKMLKVEVKSSIPSKNESVDEIIQKRDIKITASHNKGKDLFLPKDIEADIHVQIYFYATVYKKGFNNFERLYEEIKENPQEIYKLIDAKKYSKPLFLGWSSKSEIQKFSEQLKPNTWSFSKTSRVYWRCPIKEAFTAGQLIKVCNRN